MLRRARPILLVLLALAGVAALVLVASTEWLAALGGAPAGERLARMERSPNFRDGKFQNLVPTNPLVPGSTLRTLQQEFLGDAVRAPLGVVPVVPRSSADFETPPASGLRATWMGHATTLIEIDGHRVLTDPMWSERASPSTLVGPARLHPVPLPLEQVPAIDAVVVSHNHYDHLDMATVRALSGRVGVFVLPLGMGAHLERWGVAPEKIIELDWNESTQVGDLRITATPARHYSGRGLGDADLVQWASWVVAGPTRRVYYSGDTGYSEHFATIGAEHGPFDLAILKIGAYGDTWPDIHMTPEEAVAAFRDLGAGLMLPVHWATFNLSYHAWSEPPERLLVAARQAGVEAIVPRPGEPVDVADPPELEAWWEDLAPRGSAAARP